MKIGATLSAKLLMLGGAFSGFAIHPMTARAGVVLYQEAIDQIKAPSYTSRQKTLLLDQLDLVFRNLYVNRELKIKDFGTENDPLAKIQILKNQADQLDPQSFSDQVADIFTGLHDLHTSFKPAKPLACATAFIPVFFDSVESNDSQLPRQPGSAVDNRLVVVAGKALKASGEADGVALGDQVLTIDGKPIERVLKDLESLSGGANPDAMRVRALELLSMRPFGSLAKPEKNTMIIGLVGKNGPYQATLNWHAFLNENCLTGKESLPDIGKPPFGTIRRPQKPRLDWALNPFQDTFNKIYGQKPLVENPLEDSQPLSEIFEMQTIKTPAGKLGYIQLKSFYWEDENLEVGVVTETFRRELERRFGEEATSPVNGLIIDVRGNPGGIILFAERLVQLFSPIAIEPTTVRMLANDLNEKIFISANDGPNRWSESIKVALRENLGYTRPQAITPKSEANKIGQIWFKPVVVLTDARCYSACDLFAAGMQDNGANGAAKIIGIHKTTGAGGANVMEYSTFQAIMATSSSQPFVDLPFGQDFGISWRQTIRAGKNQGTLLENYGVVSDFVVPLTKADLGKESPKLMARIHEQIDALAPLLVSGLKSQHPGARVYLENSQKASWQENVWGIDQLLVFKDDRVIAQFPVDPSRSSPSSPQSVTLEIPELSEIWKDQPLVLTGMLEGKQVFRVVRELSWRGSYWRIPEGGSLNTFDSDDASPLKIENLQAGEGWQIQDGILRIGRGPRYGSRVLSRAFLPLFLGGRKAVISLDLGVKAEETNDSLRIYILDPASGERVEVFAGSSLTNQRGVKITLPANQDKLEVVFEFESDENWNLEGPEIDNLKIIHQ